MIVSIMQPYFFPYVGYFQLIAQSDVFIVHDDVQYIKGGWINRNRILADGGGRWITLPVARADHKLPINERFYDLSRRNIPRVLNQIENAYRGAPRFQEVFPFLHEILNLSNPNVAAFNTHLLERLAARLGISTPFLVSSRLPKNDRLTGQDRVIELCKHVGATQYVNPIGGLELYEPQRFASYGITLKFLVSERHNGGKASHNSISPLSIVDLMMSHGPDQLTSVLNEFKLVEVMPPSPQA